MSIDKDLLKKIKENEPLKKEDLAKSTEQKPNKYKEEFFTLGYKIIKDDNSEEESE